MGWERKRERKGNRHGSKARGRRQHTRTVVEVERHRRLAVLVPCITLRLAAAANPCVEPPSTKDTASASVSAGGEEAP
jgi:hypothetical protein